MIPRGWMANNQFQADCIAQKSRHEGGRDGLG